MSIFSRISNWVFDTFCAFCPKQSNLPYSKPDKRVQLTGQKPCAVTPVVWMELPAKELKNKCSSVWWKRNIVHVYQKLQVMKFILPFKTEAFQKHLTNPGAGRKRSKSVQKTEKCLFAITKAHKVQKVPPWAGKIQTGSGQGCQNYQLKLQGIKCPVCWKASSDDLRVNSIKSSWWFLHGHWASRAFFYMDQGEILPLCPT